ncbi:MAG: glycosyltransferase family 4 protein [Thermodesulfovibrionales bacterium]
MKILEINTERTWRGGERQTLYTVEGLRDKGINVELLCLNNYPLYRRAIKKGGMVHGVKDNLRALLFLLKNGKNFDILHCQTAKAQTLAIISKPFHGRPVVYTRRVDFRPSGILTRLKYRFTDRVIAISQKIRQILKDLKPSEEIEVIPDCVRERELDRERAFKLKTALNIRDKKILATMAALDPHKDPFTMVETIRLLSQKRKDFVFLHFGEGELKRELENRIKAYALEDRYFLMGFHEDVEDYFSIIDIFVMSSSEEGLGSVVLDAFLYKVPVVSTDAGGLKETVEGRGITCPVRDANCLANAIERLMDNEDLRKELTEKAYRDVKYLYSIERMTEDYLKIFESILSGRSNFSGRIND